MKPASAATLKRVYGIVFGGLYSAYLTKVKKKSRTEAELVEVLGWLTGYTKVGLKAQIKKGVDLQTFFKKAPRLNPKRKKITGVVCGVRVEDIKEKLMQEIRYMDKLVDDLAKGRPMEKVLRKI